MKVILTQDVDNLGERGEIVQVKDGYGRNFLIPRGMARIANRTNVKVVEEERRQSAQRIERERGDAESVAARLEKVELTIPARVGEENRIFGAITTQQIAEALAEEGIEVDRRKLELNEEVRSLGVYTATVRLHKDISAQFKFSVVNENPESAEAE